MVISYVFAAVTSLVTVFLIVRPRFQVLEFCFKEGRSGNHGVWYLEPSGLRVATVTWKSDGVRLHMLYPKEGCYPCVDLAATAHEVVEQLGAKRINNPLRRQRGRIRVQVVMRRQKYELLVKLLEARQLTSF